MDIGQWTKNIGEDNKLLYEYWLASINPLSNLKKYKLRSEIGTAEYLYYIEETKLKKISYITDKDVEQILQSKKMWNLESEYNMLKKKGIQFVSRFSEQFPRKLLDIPDVPYAIYVRGKLPAENVPTVAIVGARQCTPYGEKYALEFAKKLADAGVVIISGLAKGIDGTAQRGALMGAGKTYAVLGCGVDVCYPREHQGLYDDILKKDGGILSELLPGTQPLPHNFPRRNRIISGLADIVLVMEAREKSGSLITADMALEQGRDVYALPGCISSPLSQGCNQLIRQGAGVLISPEILLEELGILCCTTGQKIDKNKKVLEYADNMVYSCLDLYPKNLSQLAEETNLPPKELLEIIVSLELSGYIREISKNYYVKI